MANKVIVGRHALIESVRTLLRIRAIYAAHMQDAKSVAVDLIFILFLRAEEGHSLCVKQLIVEAGGSATAALRKLERLESAGLLRRLPDENDARRVRVTLTPRGRALVISMAGEISAARVTNA